jgi:RNA polymerase sigma-70 factor (ECF subfamily)
MKVAINFHSMDSISQRDAVALPRKQKPERLLSQRRSVHGRVASPARSKPTSFDDTYLREAIRLAQHGDSAAFEMIHQLHAGRVYALCLRMLHDPTEAEDALQDAFMQLFRKIHTFRGESAFSSWLHRLTANVLLMRLRQKKPTLVSIDEMVEGDDEDSKPLHEIGEPDLRLTGLVDRITLQAVVDQLPRGYKQMFILHDVQGYEHGEIAKILGRSDGNSKSQLHRARKRLRELLQGARPLAAKNDDMSRHSLTFLAS